MVCRVAAVIGALGLVFAGSAPVQGSRPSPRAVAAPVQVVHVSWGVIGYRAVGHGRPLVLLAGSDGSIDDWSPMLIDHLAAGARVYAMDYEGTGRTNIHEHSAIPRRRAHLDKSSECPYKRGGGNEIR